MSDGNREILRRIVALAADATVLVRSIEAMDAHGGRISGDTGPLADKRAVLLSSAHSAAHLALNQLIRIASQLNQEDKIERIERNNRADGGNIAASSQLGG